MKKLLRKLNSKTLQEIEECVKQKMLVILLDESCSMYDQRRELITSVNALLEKLQNGEGGSALQVRIYKFNETYERIVEGVISEVRITAAQYVPNGMTSLYDAICSVVGEYSGPQLCNIVGAPPLCNVVADQSGPPQHNTIIIATDGDDTRSKRTEAEARAVIEEAQKRGTKFIYLAQGQDAVSAGRLLGLKDCIIACKKDEDLSQSLRSDNCARIASQSVGVILQDQDVDFDFDVTRARDQDDIHIREEDQPYPSEYDDGSQPFADDCGESDLKRSKTQ